MDSLNIYLASAIDQADGSASIYEDLSKRIGDKLRDNRVPFCLFAPGLAFQASWNKTSNTAGYIYRINKYALETADALVVNYQHGVPSIGLPQEIYMAVKGSVPTFLLRSIPYNNLPVGIIALLDVQDTYVDINELIDDLLYLVDLDKD